MRKAKRIVNEALPRKGSGYQQHKLPPEISKLIKRRIVDLSTAHEYYIKCWEAVRSRTEWELTVQNCNRYKLSPRFFQFFISLLHEVVAQHRPDSNTNAADLVARALYRASGLFGIAKKGGISPYQVWPEGQPKSKAWQRLGRLPVPPGSSQTLEDPGSGHNLRLPKGGEFQNPRIQLRHYCSHDKESLPKITIEVEGEPVCILMKAMYELEDSNERRAVRKEARRIWDSLLKRLGMRLGINPFGRGRPPEYLGDEAALLHYRDGLSWRKVAEKVCPTKHQHDSHCEDNFRKQADLFFQRIRNHALSLPLVRS